MEGLQNPRSRRADGADAPGERPFLAGECRQVVIFGQFWSRELHAGRNSSPQRRVSGAWGEGLGPWRAGGVGPAGGAGTRIARLRRGRSASGGRGVGVREGRARSRARVPAAACGAGVRVSALGHGASAKAAVSDEKALARRRRARSGECVSLGSVTAGASDCVLLRGFWAGFMQNGSLAEGLVLRPGCLWRQAARGAMLEWPGSQRMVSPERRAAPCSSEGGDSLGCCRFRIAACDCGRRVAAGGGGVRQDAREAP